jgi:hypothetical protein
MNQQNNNPTEPETLGFKEQVEGKEEYTQCFETWRFFLGFRSTLLVFSFTIASALLYIFFSKDSGDYSLSAPSRALISLLGFVFTLAIITIELRNRQMYTKSLDRARAIELAGGELPPFRYNNSSYFTALWLGTIDFFKNLKWLFIKKPGTNDRDENRYCLATLLIKTPIHMFSWMTGGILFMYITMLIMWLILGILTLFCC